MSVNGISNTNPIDIAVSGLRAETTRMNVIAGNIANSNTTKTPSGKPYRRMEVILSTDEGIGGVTVDQIAADMLTNFRRVHQPGHPEADKEGYVQMPNVDLPVEMINMITASRAYQANAAVLKRYEEMVNIAIELLK
ncbi:MAG: flagellar basal body rod protein FlgC [Phycisphaerae bacterium]|nr:flagellar basal body rod protein FlgC [Phycisphaerae bacterium]